MKNDIDYTGEKFLLEIYKDTLKNSQKFNKVSISDNPLANIKKYMDILDNTHKRAIKNNHLKLLKDYYYDKYIIKKEDIDKFILNNETEREIIISQKESLDSWIDYLITNEANYPNWIKYWIFQGMLKMGVKDEDNQKYNKRTKKTIKPFVECNPEVLANAVELIIKKAYNKDLGNEKIKQLVSTGSFSKIYGTLLIQYNKEEKEKSATTEGIWIKYNQGSNEDAEKLYSSLKEYKTGWCTAAIDMAKKQICGPYDEASDGGDFYVFYTKNKNDEYKIPRIAIRMNGKNKIGEIRGIADSQCLEEILEDKLKDKLNEMTFITKDSKEQALKTCAELKILSEIVRKTHNNETLSKEEVKLLYSAKKIGFGWTQDKRVDRTIKYRMNRGLLEQDITNNKIIPILKPEIFAKIPITIDNYKNIAIAAIKYCASSMSLVPTTIDCYKEIVIEAIKNNKSAIKYIPKESMDDDIKMTIIRAYANAFNDNSSDYDACMRAVKINAYAIEYVPLTIEFYKYIALEAVKKVPSMIKIVPEKFRDDIICRETIKISPMQISNVPESLEKYKEIGLIAVKKYGEALKNIPEKKRDYEICMEAIKSDYKAIIYVPEKIDNYNKIALEAVKKNAEIIRKIPVEKRDYEICMEAVKGDYNTIKYVPKEVDNYLQIALYATRKSPTSLEYINDGLETYRYIVLETLRVHKNTIKYVSRRIIDYEVCMISVKNNWDTLYYVPTTIEGYKEIAIEAVRQNYSALKAVPTNIDCYKEIATEAIKQSKAALLLVPDELKDELSRSKNIFIGNIKVFFNNLALRKKTEDEDINTKFKYH